MPLGGETADGRYRTRLDDDQWHFEKRGPGGDWLPQMAWTTDPRTLDDFRARSEFFQQDPASPFKRGPLCTVMLPDGRLTLSKWTLITTIGEERTEQALSSEIEVQAILTEWFGIDMPITTWWEREA